MNIPSARYLKNKARNRLTSGQEPRKVMLCFAAGALSSSFAVTALRFLLGGRISETGGLHNIGLRSVLTTADSVLPLLQTVFVMCLSLGYLAAMLRIARRQYASPKTLKAGFERFWVLLRSRLLYGLIMMGVGFASIYAASILFMVSPFSDSFAALAEPMLSGGAYDPQLLLDSPELLSAMVPTLIPLLVIYCILLLALGIPLVYSFRLTDFLIIDRPQLGASAAMRASRLLMRNNLIPMLKVDLSFWWYYLLQLLSSAVLYVDLILPIMGIPLPISDTAAFFGSCLLYTLAQFGIIWYFRNYVTVTYALAYDSLIPKEASEGVVLGNIFQMQ